MRGSPPLYAIVIHYFLLIFTVYQPSCPFSLCKTRDHFAGMGSHCTYSVSTVQWHQGHESQSEFGEAGELKLYYNQHTHPLMVSVMVQLTFFSTKG